MFFRVQYLPNIITDLIPFVLNINPCFLPELGVFHQFFRDPDGLVGIIGRKSGGLEGQELYLLFQVTSFRLPGTSYQVPVSRPLFEPNHLILATRFAAQRMTGNR
ncbi:hypothetical protein A4H97_01490 [Niastella yeongjuensis]|uniref:Uncharacterized protein n=1 Tax=Niastella yeongjuensis TaxID=354355 RepID=A0A1V9EWN4_9BACT|nr:hypothetical protein A4H97_01490 [Niastella yeongjuensis]